ncbi:MarR family transcriptional regulator [Cyclobacteriaceae bacterium]|nr:MarR family transcriptional regulator [Cyclobacteriaceae bacterium]
MRIEDEIKQKKFDSVYTKAFVNLIFTSNSISDKQKNTFKKAKITHQQYNVLRILRGKYPESLNPGQIKEVMLDKSPDLTRLIDRLLVKELVHREYCKVNRRKIDIKVTEKGLSFLKEIEPEVNSAQQELSQNLTEEEANILSDLLDKLRG